MTKTHLWISLPDYQRITQHENAKSQSGIQLTKKCRYRAWLCHSESGKEILLSLNTFVSVQIPFPINCSPLCF